MKRSVRLPDPERSYAIVIGTSTYSSEGLEDLPAVGNNLTGLKGALTHPLFGGLPADRCVPVSALPLELLRDVLADSRAANRVLILDCWFSGRAIPDLGGVSEAVAGYVDVEGTYTLTATSATAVALAPVSAEYTAFTGELISLLGIGVPGGPELLTFGTLFPHLLHTLNARRLPIPRQRGIGTADRLALTRNPAYARPEGGSAGERLRRGVTPRLPEHLELLLRDEPALDVYSYGPWRVPDGLYEEIRERAVALNSDKRTDSLARRFERFLWPAGVPGRRGAVVVIDLSSRSIRSACGFPV